MISVIDEKMNYNYIFLDFGCDFSSRNRETAEKADCIVMVKSGKMNACDILSEEVTSILKNTVPEIKDVCPEFSYIEKQSFSVAGAKEFCDRLDKIKPKNIIIIGIETHICVLQSALDLLDEGFNVFVAADCVSSQ